MAEHGYAQCQTLIPRDFPDFRWSHLSGVNLLPIAPARFKLVRHLHAP